MAAWHLSPITGLRAPPRRLLYLVLVVATVSAPNVSVASPTSINLSGRFFRTSASMGRIARCRTKPDSETLKKLSPPNASTDGVRPDSRSGARLRAMQDCRAPLRRGIRRIAHYSRNSELNDPQVRPTIPIGAGVAFGLDISATSRALPYCSQSRPISSGPPSRERNSGRPKITIRRQSIFSRPERMRLRGHCIRPRGRGETSGRRMGIGGTELEAWWPM